ncbi:LicD family protein [Aliivibrio fischeri]|uniref:LicD family protein n=1 Tax=Aliivibrio fischeri TaxID=668 RepID=UPI003F75B1EC
MQLIKDNEIEYFTHETLKQQQEIMLELLSEFTQICKENNIRYWIDGGSLLGFARCGSLIPWDDDIDICVPINDYKKLEEVISSKSKGNYLFYKENNIKSWCEYYCSRDFSYKRRDGFIKPVKIDIFPIKNIPKNKVNFDVSYVDEISRYIKGSKDCFNINMVDAIKDKKQKLEEYWDYMYSMKDETSDFLIKRAWAILSY